MPTDLEIVLAVIRRGGRVKHIIELGECTIPDAVVVDSDCLQGGKFLIHREDFEGAKRTLELVGDR